MDPVMPTDSSTETESGSDKRMFSLLSTKGALLNIGWNLGSPSIVLTYMAIAQDVPVFLTGLMITVRRVANMCVDLFGATFVETRRNRAVAVAASEIALAICILTAVAGIATGSPWVIMIALVASMFGLGIASELQNILFNDFIGKSLDSDHRTRVQYWAIGFSGVGTIALAWPIHRLMIDSPAMVRHSTIVLLACACFLASALMMVGISRRMLSATRRPPMDRTEKRSWKDEIRKLTSNYRKLMAVGWFRKFMTVIIMLQSIELSLPFFAILAAVTSDESARGITALIISSALAFCVSGLLWQLVSVRSHRAVMVTASLMGASAASVLVANHFLHLVNSTALHAAALFVATVAARGVFNARQLYYLDVAPEVDRVAGITVSNSIVRIGAVGITAVLAGIAHMQHVVWAILIIALINMLTAVVCSRMVTAGGPETEAA